MPRRARLAIAGIPCGIPGAVYLFKIGYAGNKYTVPKILTLCVLNMLR